MTARATGFSASAADYAACVGEILASQDWSGVACLAEELRDCWASGRQVFLCGNGGSAANAIHLANDFLYPVSKTRGSGLRATALSSSAVVLTCIANDEGYDQVFAMQLAVQARANDVLVVLSGSGNSPNVLAAIEQAKKMSVKTYAVVAFAGGRAKSLADVVIHTAVDDMQIAEDLQLMVGHIIMRWLHRNPPTSNA